VTGYFVYQANLGSIALPKNGSQTNSDLLLLRQMIPIDSYIVGFQNQRAPGKQPRTAGRSWRPRRDSGARDWAMMLLGFAGLGFAGYRASRNSAALA
jgi:hypothetical protein